ncbi:MAG: lytic transglycosylase domain-containing protein [Candidatus Eremiobacterota bacterium]
MALLCLLLALSGAAPAREWYRPLYAGREFVNPDLTPQRALGDSPRATWNGQLVLWEGVVRKHECARKTCLELATAAGPIRAVFKTAARNLEIDRTGYRVAVKGYCRFQKGRFTHLDGRSVILLGPPSPPPPAGAAEDFLTWWLGFHNPQDPASRTRAVARALVREAGNNELDPYFFASLVQVESAFDQDAVSVSGAVGLGQLMPTTAAGLGVDPYDPDQNLAGSARMLRRLIQAWQHTENAEARALAGYNAGPNLVAELGTIPAIPQTTNYVYFIGYVHQRMSKIASRS